MSVKLPQSRDRTSVVRAGWRPGHSRGDVASFRLHLSAENKAAGTIRIYTEAPLWFAAAHLLGKMGKTQWGQVDSQDVQRWVARLLGSYSEAYARQQYRGAAAVLRMALCRG